MPRPSERAPTCLSAVLPAVLRTIVGVSVLVTSLTPVPVWAAEPAISAEAEQHYNRGISERDAGHFAAAAVEFTAAYEGIPASSQYRAGVMFEMVDAHRAAFSAGGRQRGKEHPAAHLCAADKVLEEFVAVTEAARGRKGKRSPDTNRAIELRNDLRKQITAAKQTAPELDCATVEYPREDVAAAAPPVEPGDESTKKPPRTPRKIDKPLVIAGGVLTGFGLIMVGLMAGGLVRGKRAEADGDALVAAMPTLPAEDPALQAIDHDGKVGNRMAIAGGVLGGLALGTGVALLVVGLRGGRTHKVAVAPTMAPQALGLAMRWQF